jgi:hypothetical protein
MAKAIYGHLGVDPRLLAEVARLRARVRDLEAEVERLQEEARPLDIDLLLADDLLVPDPH